MSLEISNRGKEMLRFQEALAYSYKYKSLPKDVRSSVHSKYLSELPDCFKKNIAQLSTGFEITDELFKNFKLVSRDGTQIATGFNRIVVGDYGAFIEIDQKNMVTENISIKKGQEYRMNSERYANVKYQWFTANDNSDCKLYFQQKSVSYADYKPGMWYISPYEVLNREECKQYEDEINKEGEREY